MCLTVFADGRHPIESFSYIVPPDTPLCDHFLSSHVTLQLDFSPSDLARQIIQTASDSTHFLTLLPVGLSVFNSLVSLVITILLCVVFVHNTLLVYTHFPIWGI